MDTENKVIELHNIRKTFPPSVIALDGANLDVFPGEVHCLLGANGAGKSTLLKTIAGVHQPDSGTLQFEGQSRIFHSPHEAAMAGISVIYQELDLVPELTVAENLFLGRAPNRAGLVNRGERRKLARAALDRVGASFSTEVRVETLSVANQQLTAIARALTMDARLIIMDEPSAALYEDEVERVFKVIREVVRDGRAVLYVSHRLDEVLTIGDRATVLRNGQTVSTFEIKNINKSHLVTAMIGEHRSLVEREERHTKPGEPALVIRSIKGPSGLDIQDLTVRRHEIVGLAGLNGSGRTTLLKSLFGEVRASRDIDLFEQTYDPGNAKHAIARGVGLVPEDRKVEGLILDANIGVNTTLPTLAGRWLKAWNQVTDLARDVLTKLNTRYNNLNQPAGQLSGGNQQKVVLGKWLAKGSQMLLLDEPSRGLDVGAKADLYEQVRHLADNGAAVLVASSELDELVVNCDIIWVLHEGRNVQCFDPATTPKEDILHATITG